ncbi:MAG: aldolase [Pirellulaceae bacterium]|nr:aldolase [Pirellulaceae bacterium]
MRKSRVKAKLRQKQPVLLTTLHIPDPQLFELTSLLGFDGIWLDLEHHGFTEETAAHLARATRVGSSDIMIRPAKGEFMKMCRLFEIGATGIMYPRCDNAAEAREVVKWAKFAPQGQRGIDSAGADNPYCLMPLTEYLPAANAETFVVIQIEDPAAIGHADEMAAVPGVDVLFLGPGDYSILAGIPGQMDHAIIKDAMQNVASAAKKAGKDWGMPIFSTEHAKQVMELGGRFLCHGCDLLMVKNGLEEMQRKFEPLGVTFEQRA